MREARGGGMGVGAGARRMGARPGRETEERAAGARRRGVQRISYFLTDFAFI